MRNKLPLIVITGPTAVGKTALTTELAQKLNGEIINGDSMQVYKHLNIGTGKITPEEMEGIPHHLLDILEVDEDYSASHFQQEAMELIQDIHQRGKLPIVEGGSGLYIEGLLFGLEFGHSSQEDESILKALEEELEAKGSLAMWEQLKQVDPAAARKIPYQNARRTLRALQVYRASGQLFSEQDGHERQESPYHYLLLVLDRPREELYARINARVLQMVEAGLEEEARFLAEQVASENFQSLKGIGYKEWLPYFEGDDSKENVIQRIQRNSRRYAKRQLTWFRNRFEKKVWLNLSSETFKQQLEDEILSFLEDIKQNE